MTDETPKTRSPLEALSIERFKGKTYVTERMAQASGITPNLVLNNPNRVFLEVINLSTLDLYIAFDRGVDITHGIYVPAGGGVITLSSEEDGEAVGYPLHAYVGGTVTTIRIIEVIRS